jgi:hypothetical protein
VDVRASLRVTVSAGINVHRTILPALLLSIRKISLVAG